MAGHAGRRRIALGAIIALAGGCSLVLLNVIHLGQAWVHGAASLAVLTAALAVLVVANSVGSRRSLPPRPPVL